MRFIEQVSRAQPIKLDADSERRLIEYLNTEIEDAITACQQQHENITHLLRQYEGVPRNPSKNIPIENAPNIEVTIGAIACDSIYAQAYDLIYTASPLITVTATNVSKTTPPPQPPSTDGTQTKAPEVPDGVKIAKAVQRFSNFVASKTESNVKPASQHSLLDDVQLGTGIFYIPWVMSSKKAKTRKILDRGPRVYSVPIEDFFVRGGEYEDLQSAQWVAMRTWPNKNDLDTRAKAGKWDEERLKKAQKAGNKDFVRSRRELLGRTRTAQATKADIFEVFDFYCYFDIDNDGVAEDLFVVYDRTARTVLYCAYNPYDSRPFEAMRYQLRGHLFYGLGVQEMISPFQQQASDIFNFWTVNMLLANCRDYFTKPGALPEGWKRFPGKVNEVPDPDSVKVHQMADVYPSAPQALAMVMSLGEKRVGVNEMSMPRPSQVLGSRTPGITAISLLQQVNRRFTPAFDDMRAAVAGSLKQCLYRYQEKLLAGDKSTMDYILETMGPEDGALIIDTLKDENFDNGYAVELTASSASTNKEADRQASLMLVNVLSQYYQKVLELMTVATNPQTPPPVKEIAVKIAEAAGEIIDRTIRTFDTIKDPSTFIIDITNAVDQVQAPQGDMMGLLTALGQQGGGAFSPPEVFNGGSGNGGQQ